MPRSLWLPPVVLAFLAGGCHHKILPGGIIDPEAVVAVGERVSGIRGLPFLRPVRVRLTGMEDLQGMAATEAAQERASGRAERQGTLLAMLGLVPWGRDPASATEAIVSSQPAGYYLPDRERLEIVARDHLHSEVVELAGLFAGRDLTYGEIVAHELTHALQHQHFGLDPPAAAASNGDATLAHAALAEGDATLVGFELGVGGLVTDLESFLGFARRHAPDMGAGVPSYYQERFKFPYLDGGAFVLALQEQGGFDAIDRAHRRPPRSTEEILHPEKYQRGDDPPRLPDLAGAANAAGGFRLLHEETLGEFGVRTLLLSGERRQARRRAAGWGGDRAALLEHERSGDLLLVWVIDWDTPADAADFVSGLEPVLLGRYGDPVRASDFEMHWISVRRIRHLEHWGERVVLVDAPAAHDPYLLVQAAFGSASSPPASAPEVARDETAAPLETRQALVVDVQRPPPRDPGPSLRFGSADTHLAVGSLLQVRGGRGDDRGLAVQRLRARAAGTVTRALDLRLSVEFELAGDDAGLLDAAISFAPVSPHLLYLGHLHIGRFRVPFSTSVLLDPEFLALGDRPLGATRLAPDRRTGLMYDLDLGRHGIPLRLRGGGFDGFPEAGGFGPLAAVRLDFDPGAWLGPLLELRLGAAYLHDARHQDEATGAVRDWQGITVDGWIAWRGYHLQGELFLLDRLEESGLETLGWAVTAGAFLLPDFLQLVARCEELKPPDGSDLLQVSGGVNLFYLAERFRMSYNFVWRREKGVGDGTRHLIIFQLVL